MSTKEVSKINTVVNNFVNTYLDEFVENFIIIVLFMYISSGTVDIVKTLKLVSFTTLVVTLLKYKNESYDKAIKISIITSSMIKLLS